MKNTALIKKIGLSILALLGLQYCNAQQGVSSASVSHTVSNGLTSLNEGGSPNRNTIIVEDFMNYHEHQITMAGNNDVRISIQYDNKILDNGNILVQVGLATQTAAQRQGKKNKVNVALVIDNSGSMDDGKLEKVKRAAKVFVNGLGDNDFLSIVKFDGNAYVVLPSSKVGNSRRESLNLIEHIYPSGSTNLNAGMQAGYEEVLKNFSKNYNNRVVVLTDGMTNTGITDHEKILVNSKKYNDMGIDISTIGVGQSLDFDLLRSIADNGNGSNYFIGDKEEDIQKTFIDELESLLYSIGRNPTITFTFPEEMKIKTFYGYRPEYRNSNKISVNLSNLDCGQTQVFLIEVENSKQYSLNKITAQLNYEKNGEPIKAVASQFLDKNSNANAELEKNYQIAKMATALQEASLEFQNNRKENAYNVMKNIALFYKENCDTKDKDLMRIFDIVTTFTKQLSPTEVVHRN